MYKTMEAESSFKSIGYIETYPGLAALENHLFLEF